MRALGATPAPNRFLFWWIVGVFLTIVIAAIIGFLVYSAQGRLVALFPVILITALVLSLGTIILTFVFRKSVPRWLSVVVAVGIPLLWVGGVFAGISYFQTSLAPRFQNELVTQVPFLRAYLPPTPMGGAIPTAVPQEGQPSAADLLLGGSGANTATPTQQPPTATRPAATFTLAPTMAASATLQPSSTPTAAPTQAAVIPTTQPPTAAAVVAPSNSSALPSTAYNGGFRHFRQTWNNCGPANLAMSLSFFGWQGDQTDTAALLKPEREDKNVSPYEMVRYVLEQTQLRAITRIGGDLDLIKSLVAAGFPVIVEIGYMPEGEGWLGHYQTVVGYDDAQQSLLVFDSWLGTGDNGSGIPEAYAEFDDAWQAFNRVFIIIYEPQREAEVQRLIGELAEVTAANEHALEIAQAEARADRQNGFAWFNMGSALTRLGRYEDAANAFDIARQQELPFRMLFYQHGPFEAYYNVERYDDVIALVNSTLISSDNFIEEAHYWQGRVFLAEGNATDARAAFQRAISLNQRFEAAQTALTGLG
jgi:Peptidase_C39 like family/Tetratricopeptide repeat